MHALTAFVQAWNTFKGNKLLPFVMAASIILTFEVVQYAATLFALNGGYR
jgi:hypothetical protein